MNNCYLDFYCKNPANKDCNYYTENTRTGCCNHSDINKFCLCKEAQREYLRELIFSDNVTNLIKELNI
jgi:hypothetical protein